jgi:hypothetical protein
MLRQPIIPPCEKPGCGVVQHPATKRWQVWLSEDGKELYSVGSYPSKDEAFAVCNPLKEKLRNTHQISLMDYNPGVNASTALLATLPAELIFDITQSMRLKVTVKVTGHHQSDKNQVNPH